MIALLSPAKSLDFESSAPFSRATQLRFQPQTAELVQILRSYSPTQLASLMNLSEKLAELNHERYQAHEPDFTKDNSKQALCAFTGDVYQGFSLPNWTNTDFSNAQKQIRILSGLYGLMRPLDLIQPYRLEMGTKLPTTVGKNLYQFWGNLLTTQLENDLKKEHASAVINLASKEYSSALQFNELSIPVISPVFKDEKNGTYKIISFYAKKARGLMADYLVTQQLSEPAELKGFNSDGYQFVPEESDDTNYVFQRSETARS